MTGLEIRDSATWQTFNASKDLDSSDPRRLSPETVDNGMGLRRIELLRSCWLQLILVLQLALPLPSSEEAQSEKPARK